MCAANSYPAQPYSLPPGELKAEKHQNNHEWECAKMVLSVLIAFGVVTGASEGLKASQSKARREEHRSRKNNLIVHVPKSSEHSQILESRRIVLSGDKVSRYLSVPRHAARSGSQHRLTNIEHSCISTPVSTMTLPSGTPSKATILRTRERHIRVSCPASPMRPPS